jgi:uncharacterized protein
MTNAKIRGIKISIPLVIGACVAALLALLLILIAVFGTDFLVDMWWFNALGYGFYFWQRKLYSSVVFIGVTAFFFLVFFLNFKVAARAISKKFTPDDTPAENRRRKLINEFKSGSVWLYIPLSLAMSIPIALPLYRQWRDFLFYIFGSSASVTDPFLGKDISFYLFSYPIYTLIQRRLLLALIVLTVFLGLLYVAKNHLLERPWFGFSRGAIWHLSLLVMALFGIEIWDFMLQRYSLVYDISHKALFYGPGYIQMKVVLPLIWGCMLTLAAAAVSLFMVIHMHKGYKTCIVLVVCFFVVLALRYTDFLPRSVQTYVVKPNEIEKESPYITKHIKATLAAYNLTHLEVRQFTHQRLPAEKGASQMDAVLRNIPLWDAETLADVFYQLQELRTYYVFPAVSVGRYDVQGVQQQVFLSPREMDFSSLPSGARNWINEHLTYTHGFGVVMTPASQTSGDTMNWYLQNIPPESNVGMSIAQPRIYYGMGQYTYCIVPNSAGEMDYPKGNTNVMTDYSGKGGVPISSIFRRYVFSRYFKNRNIFFSTKFSDQSKVLFRRNIIERIHRLAPFLLLDQTPYLAVTAKGIYWIVDAYTYANDYPGSAPYTLGKASFNYIRNSVKIVVDAFDGSIKLFIYDTADPIIKAYDRIYPGLFLPKDQMPEELKAHVRYPKDLFTLQMKFYANYHQEDPQVFYQQEDLWTSIENAGDKHTIEVQPYYVTLDLIKPGHMDFLLLLPMFPKDRDNLRAVAIAGCDPGHYGKLIIYDFPKGELVYGPAQVDALINQDPDIARQFTLWDQAGTHVVRGKMIILPVGNSVLFIQPVYLKATSRVTIPKLQRVIMSEGAVVVMEKSVHEAYNQLIRLVDQQTGSNLGQPAPAPVKAAPTAPAPAKAAPAAPAPVKAAPTAPAPAKAAPAAPTPTQAAPSTPAPAPAPPHP